MWPGKDSSALIGGNFIFSKQSMARLALQSECSNFNQWEHSIYVIFITGHMIYNLVYTGCLIWKRVILKPLETINQENY